MQNPEITDIQYQQGTLAGYETREYLLEKWGRKCSYCGKEHIPLQIEVRRIGDEGRAQQMLLELREGSMHTPLTLNLERGRRPEHVEKAA